MKSTKSFFLVFLLAAGSFLHAQSPEKMSYQAIIRNGSNQLVINSNIGIQVSILQGSITGNGVYIERHFPLTNDNGLISIEIGGGTVVSGSFVSIDWANGPYFIKTETDLNGGSNYTIAGTSQLLSVPFALYAKTAENNFSGDYNDLENKPDFMGWDDNASDDFSGSYSDLTDKPVLFSGDYNDLTNKPVVPAINDASISTTSLWSSTKTNTELGNKANVADVYTKTNLQMAGQSVVNYGNLSQKPGGIDEDKTDDVTISGNQTISGNKTFSNIVNANNGLNVNNKTITNVAEPTLASDAVNKAYVDILESKIKELENIIMFNGLLLKDIDGNFYKTVRIEDQVWMAENLRVIHYANGDSICNGTTAGNIDGLEEPKLYFNYQNNPVMAALYGCLYTYDVIIDPRNVCPKGWHVPSIDEWETFITAMGGSSIAGGKLKEIGFSHWFSPNTGATDEIGFMALPAGYRSYGGGFDQLGYRTFFWTSTSSNSTYANGKRLQHDIIEIGTHETYKKDGISVRCIKN
jgi:uncharacterized protein (TIGR02145 family)